MCQYKQIKNIPNELKSGHFGYIVEQFTWSDQTIGFCRKEFSMKIKKDARLDPALSQPLYLQARNRISKIIRKKKSGNILPQERILAKEWNVSRITIRNAYIRLAEEGYVMKTHKAYRVAPRLRSTGLFMLNGFTQDAVARGNIPQTKVLSVELVYPPKETAKMLSLDAKQMTYRLIRKRFLNDRPVAVEYAYLSEKLAPGLDKHPLESLYKILSQKYKITIHRAQQNFSLYSGKTPQHEELKLADDKPILRLKRVSFSIDNKPVEFVEGYYNIYDVEFYMEAHR